MAEKRSIEFFQDYLYDYGEMHFMELMDSLPSGDYGIFYYFSTFTTADKYRFFANHSNDFVIQNSGYVSLTASALNMLNEGKVLDFFDDILEANTRLHYRQLVKHLKSSDSSVSNYFEYFSDSELYRFFQNYTDYIIEKDGYVSLAVDSGEDGEESSENEASCSGLASEQSEGVCQSGSSNSENVVEEMVLEKLASILAETEPMHYFHLTNRVSEHENYDVQQFFSQFSPSEKFRFFKSRPKMFKINNDGCVSLSRPICETRKQEDVAVDFFISILETTDKMHYVQLVKKLQNSKSDAKNCFNHYTDSERYQFFKNRPTEFVIRNDGYVSLPNVLEDEEKPEEVKTHLGSAKNKDSNCSGFARDQNDCIYQSGSSKSENVVEEMVLEKLASILMKTKPMHYLQLTNRVSEHENHDVQQYFGQFTPSEKFKFFRNRPKVFNINNDGCVSLNCPIGQTGEQEDAAVDFFISILQTTDQMHYEQLVKNLQSSQCDAKNCFDHYNGSERYRFFKSHPTEFVLRNDGYVSLRSVLENDEEKPEDEATTHVESAKNNEAYCGEIVSKQNECIHQSGSSNSENVVWENELENSVDQVDVLRTNSSTNRTEEYRELSISDAHSQAIIYCIAFLERRNVIHYHKLLYKVCRYDRSTSDFFSYFTLADVLEFFRMHSMYFSVEDSGVVTLADSSTKIDKVFVSKDHVRRVTSAMESKAVEFFVRVLSFRKRAEFSELEGYVGSAPGYVLSFFVANYYGEDFPNFFRHRQKCFLVLEDGCVELARGITRANVPWKSFRAGSSVTRNETKS